MDSRHSRLPCARYSLSAQEKRTIDALLAVDRSYFVIDGPDPSDDESLARIRFKEPPRVSAISAICAGRMSSGRQTIARARNGAFCNLVVFIYSVATHSDCSQQRVRSTVVNWLTAGEGYDAVVIVTGRIVTAEA